MKVYAAMSLFVFVMTVSGQSNAQVYSYPGAADNIQDQYRRGGGTFSGTDNQGSTVNGYVFGNGIYSGTDIHGNPVGGYIPGEPSPY